MNYLKFLNDYWQYYPTIKDYKAHYYFWLAAPILNDNTLIQWVENDFLEYNEYTFRIETGGEWCQFHFEIDIPPDVPLEPLYGLLSSVYEKTRKSFYLFDWAQRETYFSLKQNIQTLEKITNQKLQFEYYRERIDSSILDKLQKLHDEYPGQFTQFEIKQEMNIHNMNPEYTSLKMKAYVNNFEIIANTLNILAQRHRSQF